MNLTIQDFHESPKRCSNCYYDFVGLCQFNYLTQSQEERCKGADHCKHWASVNGTDADNSTPLRGEI